MTDTPQPTPVAESPKSSAINDFYKSNQALLDRILFLIISAIIAYVFHGKLSDIGQDVNSNKDIAAKTAEIQQKVVAVEVRGTPQDVAALKATTQSAEQTK